MTYNVFENSSILNTPDIRGNVNESYPNQTTSTAPVHTGSSDDYPLWIKLDSESAQKLRGGDKIRDTTGLRETYIVRENQRNETEVIAASLSGNSAELSIRFDQLGNYFEICLDRAEQHFRWMNRPLMPGRFGIDLNDNFEIFNEATETGKIHTVQYRNVSDDDFNQIQTTTFQKILNLLYIPVETIHDVIACPIVTAYYASWMARKIDHDFFTGKISRQEFMNQHKYYHDYITKGKHFVRGAMMGSTLFLGTLELANKFYRSSGYIRMVAEMAAEYPAVATLVAQFGSEVALLAAGGIIALLAGGLLALFIYKLKSRNREN